jgi:hypothetical protein
MDKALMDLIYQAAMTASREMGSDVLSMSCYVSTWQGLSHDEVLEELEAA